jgi:hypothetical protein
MGWSKIDDHRKFQRLVNHLFSQECDSPGFIPSSPNIGADGAWDGRYKGYYSREGKGGLWSIQSKWTTKSKKKAMPHLKAEVRKELANAAVNRVDHLRIATNAELDVDQVIELENLGRAATFSLAVWHREELTRRIELQPYLRHLFFGDPQHPKLVPWNKYFDEYEPDLLPIANTRIRTFEEYVEKAKEFLRSGTSSVLLVCSPGGYGKSHLLRSIAQIARQVDNKTQVWMIRGGVRTMEDATQDEMVAGRRYLLVFDDADLFLNEIKPLLSLVRGSNSIKVIFSLRTAGRENIYRNVRETRLGEFCDEIRISDWKKEDLITLLRAAANLEQVQDESTIVALYPNPFLIAWIGRRISGKSFSPLDNIKRAFVDEMDTEAETCLGTSGRDFLVNLACVVPLERNHDNSFAVLGATIGVDDAKAQDITIELANTGLLRVVGRKVRFNPDMKGDLYLANRLETIDQSKLEGLIATWLPICAERLLINLASAARFANVPAVEESLSRITRSWSKGDISPFLSKKEVLDVIERLVAVIPEQCVDVLDAFLNSREKLTTDDYGPAISALIRITTLRHRVLETIRIMHAMGIQGTYSNYRAESLARICVSPLHNSIQTIEKTLGFINQWLDRPGPTEVKLLSAALCEVLAGTHEYVESGILTMTWGERSLKDTPEVRGLRKHALRMLEHMIDHDSLEVKLAAIAVSEEIGSVRMRSVDESTLPLATTIREERELLTKKIGELISRDLHFVLIHRIEQLFLRWWAQLTPGTDETEQYLKAISRIPEYRVFSHFLSGEWVINDFEAVRASAPMKDRWKWFVHTYMRKALYTTDEFNDLVSKLEQQFTSADEILELLVRIDVVASAHGKSTYNPPIVTCWVKRKSEIFVSIHEDDRLWRRVPERFKHEIELAIIQTDERQFWKFAQVVFRDLSDKSSPRVQSFLAALVTHPITKVDSYSSLIRSLDEGKSERITLTKLCLLASLESIRSSSRGTHKNSITQLTLYAWISKLLCKGNTKVRSLVLFHLESLTEKIGSTYLLVKLMRVALSKEKELVDQTIFNLSLIIHRNGARMNSLHSKAVRLLHHELLEKLELVSEITWDAQDLLDFACCDIDTLTAFIESRVQRSLQNRYDGYSAVPLEGINCLFSLTKSYPDFERLMNTVVAWHGRGPIWRMYLKHLMTPAVTPQNAEEHKQHLDTYIRKHAAKGRLTDVMVACEFLELNERTAETFIDVGERGISNGETKGVESLFHRKTFPDGAWSYTTGQTAPALSSKRELFEDMRSRTQSGQLKVILADCVRSIDTVIKVERDADQEILNPRA